MNRFRLCALLCFSCAATPVLASSDTEAKKAEVSKDNYHEISTDSVKKIIDQKKPVYIYDARRKLKGGLLPGAKNLPYDSTDKEFASELKTVPKNAMIIVYCANRFCPLSKYLAEHLVELGYTDVYKYTDGVAGWLDNDYPLDPIKNS